MTFNKTIGLAAALLITLSTQAQASDYKIGTLEIEHPWARASAGMAGAAGAFMEIENEGKVADRLLSATSPVAGMVQIHETRMKNNIMTMNHVMGIDIPADGKVKLKPGGYHVMLMKLAAPLKVGETFPLTLTFEKAGSVEVTVQVMKPGASGHKHDMKHMKKKSD